MKKDTGIVLNGNFVEQHGAGASGPPGSAPRGHEAPGTVTDRLRAVRDGLAAGRKFAQDCESEGLPKRAFRI